MFKLKSFLIILAIVTILPVRADAYLGSYSDPIYIEIKTNPLNNAIRGLETQTQQVMEEQRQNNLTQQQNNILKASMRTVCDGYFGDCYQQMCGDLNTGDAGRESSCLQFVQSCCDRKIRAQQYVEEARQQEKLKIKSPALIYTPPTSGASAKATATPVPLSPNQVCVNAFGAHSKYAGYINSNGSYQCDCYSGYQVKYDNGPCVKIETPITPTQPIIKPAVAPTKEIKPAVNNKTKNVVPAPAKAVKQASTSTLIIPTPEVSKTYGDVVKEFFFGMGSHLKNIIFRR